MIKNIIDFLSEERYALILGLAGLFFLLIGYFETIDYQKALLKPHSSPVMGIVVAGYLILAISVVLFILKHDLFSVVGILKVPEKFALVRVSTRGINPGEHIRVSISALIRIKVDEIGRASCRERV